MSGDDARVGVDVGGTFTDVVVVREGRVSVRKTPSTPDEPEQGVVDGLERAREQGDLVAEAVGFLGHGTTVATNAVLERDWAETALVTTEGFRDVLEIGRQARPDIYDFQAEKPDPIVPRHRRFEVPERLDERGRVVTPIDEDAVREVADALAAADDVESVAVSLLFAFEDDRHERCVADGLRDAGFEGSVSLSSAVLPEIREYERTLATALNAALEPLMGRYLAALVDRVRGVGVGVGGGGGDGDSQTDAGVGIDAPLKVMQSNGGLVDADAAGERPVDTLLSGPAAGVQGAAYVAGRAGYGNVVTMDMGGTSCDVSLVRDGEPLMATETAVGDYPVGVPSVDVHTVGAGGGSIAWVDSGGALRVGPRSAGAEPGPVCYGRGGTAPTITDAQVVLGRIEPSRFLSEIDPDPDAVRDAIERDVADPLGIDVEAAARGVLEVANANMERALRVVSVERGHDPRDFALVAYGGAGPLHAPALAESLDVPHVLVPRAAGVLSAHGLLISDVLYDRSTSRVRPLADVDPADLEAWYADATAEGRDRLADEGFTGDRARFERTADLRYVGQSFELPVSVPEPLGDDDLESVARRFHERYRERYGHASPDEPVELVTLRLRARGVVDPPDLRAGDPGGTLDDAVLETRPVGFDDDRIETPVYVRDRLPTDAAIDGPAVVEGPESTTVVRPGQRARVADDATLVVEVDP